MNIKRTNPLLRRIPKLEKAIRIRFRKQKHLISAFVHTSSRDHHETKEISVYERLEFFGDAILNFVICEKLFSAFPHAHEGTMSQLRSTLVSKKVLARIAKKISLGRFLVVGNENQNEATQHVKVLADTLEALIGAIYLDRGLVTVRKFILKNWAVYFNEKKLRALDPNPKSTLQEIVQKTFGQLPIYKIVPRAGGFSANVSIHRKLSGKGTGRSKQEAEEEAAQNLIQKLKSGKIYTRSRRESQPKLPKLPAQITRR